MGVYTDKECKVPAESQEKGWYGKHTLTKPVGVCTTNVIGSSVKFACENGVIQEHVFIDATAGNAPKTPDCSGPKKYVMPIKNGCNNYQWGNMYMTWKGFCEKDDGNKGDKASCQTLSPHMAPIVAFTKQTKDTLSDSGRASFCHGMTSMAKDSMALMKGCFPDVMKKVMEMCGKGDGKKPETFTYDVGLVYTDKECKVPAESQEKGWYGKHTLTKPVGVCTTNVIGSSVKFACENGVIQEHVFIDATAGNAPKTPDCSGPKKYVMPIKNGCNNYNWGNMYMAWKGWCEVRKGDDGKGDGKDKPENNPICVA